MLVVDASCLYELVSRGSYARQVRLRLDADPDLAAPHLIDVEVLSTIRRDRMRGLLDDTAALIALNDLREWPGVRLGHQPLLRRVWELKDNVRGWDAFYVALAERVQGTLITRDRRLARSPGIRCSIEVIPSLRTNGA
jgi:predicted nucleic acid-binding protein